MLVAALALGLVLATPVRAQGLIRDAEIEATLTRIATPLFKAAGVNPSHIEVLVVNDGSLNAFVMDGRAIFVHSGLIMRLETIDMLQSVIGHEIAHITSGHLVQRTLNLRTASNAARIGCHSASESGRVISTPPISAPKSGCKFRTICIAFTLLPYGRRPLTWAPDYLSNGVDYQTGIPQLQSP